MKMLIGTMCPYSQRETILYTVDDTYIKVGCMAQTKIYECDCLDVTRGQFGIAEEHRIFVKFVEDNKNALS